MYSIAICDDDQQLCFYIENVILEYSNKTGKTVKTEVLFSGEELYEQLKSGRFFDLIFLDIEMNRLSGIEVGMKIRDEMENEAMQIVFISSFEKYALELFNIRPLNFLLKPLEEIKIIKVIEKSIKFSNKRIPTFTYHIKHEMYKVLLDDILYFSIREGEVRIHLLNDTNSFYSTLDSVYNELCQYDFIRIHRSFLVNYNKIKIFMKDKVLLINDEILPISRKKQKEVWELIDLLEKDREDY